MVLFSPKKLAALVVATSLLAAFSPAQAQAPAAAGKTTWSLQECLDHARQHNLQLKQSALDAELAQVNVQQAQANRLPILNASSSYGYSFGRSIDPTENTYTNQQISSNNYSLSASVPVFNGFQIQNTIKRNQLDLQAAGAEVERVRNDITLNIVSSYLQVIFSDELLRNAQLRADNTRQQAERTQKLFRAGSVAESNVLEINAQLATDELEIINAQNQKDLAELRLIQLLDLKNVPDFEVVKPDIPDPENQIIAVNPNAIYEVAQERMPQIRAADLRVNSALKGIEISRGAYYPRLALGGSIATNYSSARPFFLQTGNFVPQPIGFADAAGTQPVIVYVPGRISQKYPYLDQLSDNRGESIFLSLNIPILNGFSTRNNVHRAIVNHKYAVVNTEVVRNQLRQNIQQAYADALAAQKKFSATKRQLNALEQTFRNAEIRFNNGLLNPFDYNVARNNLTRAQSDLIQAKYDYTFKLKILDFYQGKSLSF